MLFHPHDPFDPLDVGCNQSTRMFCYNSNRHRSGANCNFETIDAVYAGGGGGSLRDYLPCTLWHAKNDYEKAQKSFAQMSSTMTKSNKSVASMLELWISEKATLMQKHTDLSQQQQNRFQQFLRLRREQQGENSANRHRRKEQRHSDYEDDYDDDDDDDEEAKQLLNQFSQESALMKSRIALMEERIDDTLRLAKLSATGFHFYFFIFVSNMFLFNFFSNKRGAFSPLLQLWTRIRSFE